MKKICLFVTIICLFCLTGCGKYGEKDIMKDLENKIKNTKAYYLEGNLEIVNFRQVIMPTQ